MYQGHKSIHLVLKERDRSHSLSTHVGAHSLTGGRFSSRAVVLLSNPNQKGGLRPASTRGTRAARQTQGSQGTSTQSEMGSTIQPSMPSHEVTTELCFVERCEAPNTLV